MLKVPLKKYLNGFGGVLILLIGFLLLSLRSRSPKSPKEIITDSLKTAGLNSENIRYWVAVSAHETNGWRSDLFNENNNLFGMKNPKVRATTSTGENRGHAVFPSLEASANDQLLYLNAIGAPLKKNFASVDDLVAKMKEVGYYTDTQSNYLSGVKYWLGRI